MKPHFFLKMLYSAYPMRWRNNDGKKKTHEVIKSPQCASGGCLASGGGVSEYKTASLSAPRGRGDAAQCWYLRWKTASQLRHGRTLMTYRWRLYRVKRLKSASLAVACQQNTNSQASFNKTVALSYLDAYHLCQQRASVWSGGPVWLM